MRGTVSNGQERGTQTIEHLEQEDQQERKTYSVSEK